jgi:uncharacterized protein (TIGR01777 family)
MRLVRHRKAADDDAVYWSPGAYAFDAERLESVHAVIHLAGENIADGRWTDAKRRAIRESRVKGTQLLCEGIAGLTQKPDTLIFASAVGYYGSRGDQMLIEDDAAGTGFLAEVSQEWESAADPAREAGIRVVTLRLGVVLAREGGMLDRMLTPFRLGLGGAVGSGEQYISWIALTDLVALIDHALRDTQLSGPVNAVAPNPVTNAEFAKTLGRVLHRPTVFRLPAWLLRTALGEMADELLLPSVRAVPRRLEQTDFEFLYPGLEGALRAELARPP